MLHTFGGKCGVDESLILPPDKNNGRYYSLADFHGKQQHRVDKYINFPRNVRICGVFWRYTHLHRSILATISLTPTACNAYLIGILNLEAEGISDIDESMNKTREETNIVFLNICLCPDLRLYIWG